MSDTDMIKATVGGGVAFTLGGFVPQRGISLDKGLALAGIVGLIGNLVQYLAQQAVAGQEITLGDATWNALLGLIAGGAAFALGPIIAVKIVELQMLPVPTIMGSLTRAGRRNAEINQLVDRMMRPLTQGIWGFLTGACSNVPRPGN